jgi:hypothetical protein
MFDYLSCDTILFHFRRVCFVAFVALLLCGFGGSWAVAQTQSPWQMAKIPKIIPFGKAIGVHGDAPKFQYAPAIPASGSSRWVPAPDTKSISFLENSRLCGTSTDCFEAADFVFFQSEIVLPTTMTVNSFVMRAWGLDDGLRITIFNAKFPSGISPTEGFVRAPLPNGGGAPQSASTADLAKYIAVGGKNRIVITVMDDCCSEMALRAIEILVNGKAISSPASNQPPSITSVPPKNASIAVPFVYTIVAYDPDGDALTYTLKSGPEGASVDPTTGRVSWTPKESDKGKTHTFEVEVCDARGACVTHTWTVVIPEGKSNQPPSIQSTPAKQVVVGATYTYIVVAQDPNPNDTLVFQLVNAPSGAVFDPKSATLEWKAPATEAGKTVSFSVKVCDPFNACDTQEWSVQVIADGGGNLPPVISSLPPTLAYPGVRYIYIIDATDPNPNDTLKGTLKEGPSQAEVNSSRLFVVWTPTTNDQGKRVPFTVNVCDNAGACDTQTWTVEVIAPSTSTRNFHPRFVTRPAVSANAGTTYRYVFEAIDPNPFDVVTYRLQNAPDGATMAKDERVITWSVPQDAAGKHVIFQVLACDQNGACTEQEWQVSVAQRCQTNKDCPATMSCSANLCVTGETIKLGGNHYTGGSFSCSTGTPNESGMTLFWCVLLLLLGTRAMRTKRPQ